MNTVRAHDLSLFEVLQHRIDVAKLLASGLWRHAPDCLRLYRTRRGLKVWWALMASEER